MSDRRAFLTKLTTATAVALDKRAADQTLSAVNEQRHLHPAVVTAGTASGRACSA